MNNTRFTQTKDTIIILFIFIIMCAVIFVFYSEIIKNYKIYVSKNNFSIVKDELSLEFLHCRDKKLSWSFGGSCSQHPTTEIISNYFNNTKKLLNPYDEQKGVNGAPGSILIKFQDNVLILSVDIDANGGIDIYHRIKIE